MSRPTSFLSTDSIHHLTHRYRQQRQTREQIIQLVTQAIEKEPSISHVNKRLMKGGELAFDAPIGGVTSHTACCIEVAFRYKQKLRELESRHQQPTRAERGNAIEEIHPGKQQQVISYEETKKQLLTASDIDMKAVKLSIDEVFASSRRQLVDAGCQTDTHTDNHETRHSQSTQNDIHHASSTSIECIHCNELKLLIISRDHRINVLESRLERLTEMMKREEAKSILVKITRDQLRQDSSPLPEQTSPIQNVAILDDADPSISISPIDINQADPTDAGTHQHK